MFDQNMCRKSKTLFLFLLISSKVINKRFYELVYKRKNTCFVLLASLWVQSKLISSMCIIIIVCSLVHGGYGKGRYIHTSAEDQTPPLARCMTSTADLLSLQTLFYKQCNYEKKNYVQSILNKNDIKHNLNKAHYYKIF